MDTGHPDMAALLVTVVFATLTLVAWQDWKYRRIPNLAVFTLLLCALLRWSQFSGIELERMLEVHGINVLLALLIAIPGSMKSVFGAGDTKLLIVLALLWPTDQFLQVFSIGVITLLAGCLVLDAAKNQFGSSTEIADTATSAIALPTMQALVQRGLPLGTALGIGALLNALT